MARHNSPIAVCSGVGGASQAPTRALSGPESAPESWCGTLRFVRPPLPISREIEIPEEAAARDARTVVRRNYDEAQASRMYAGDLLTHQKQTTPADWVSRSREFQTAMDAALNEWETLVAGGTSVGEDGRVAIDADAAALAAIGLPDRCKIPTPAGPSGRLTLLSSYHAVGTRARFGPNQAVHAGIHKFRAQRSGTGDLEGCRSAS